MKSEYYPVFRGVILALVGALCLLGGGDLAAQVTCRFQEETAVASQRRLAELRERIDSVSSDRMEELDRRARLQLKARTRLDQVDLKLAALKRERRLRSEAILAGAECRRCDLAVAVAKNRESFGRRINRLRAGRDGLRIRGEREEGFSAGRLTRMDSELARLSEELAREEALYATALARVDACVAVAPCRTP